MRTKLALISCLAVAGVSLAACGDGTTATQDASTSSGPKKSSSTAATTTTDFSATQPADGDTATPSAGAEAADAAAQATQLAVPLTTAEDAFLQKLQQQGITLSVGTGSQVVASAHEYCLAQKNGTQSFTLPAVAGQLVEQNVTTMSTEAVVTMLESAAKDTICSG